MDDVSVLMKFPGNGLRWKEGQLIKDEAEVENDACLSRDVVAARLVISIANSLPEESDIQMTYDTPSMNSCGMLPVLDLQMWCENNAVLFTYYEKPMTSPYVLRRDSAFPWLMKKVTLAGEVSRRLLNTSPVLVDKGLAEEHLDYFRFKMLCSGYSLKEREVIIKEGKSRYVNLRALSESGKRDLYRHSSWQKEERDLVKKGKKLNWYGKDADTVIFVQATPEEIQKKIVESIVTDAGFKVKVVERGGRSVSSILQRSDIDPQLCCDWDDDCLICKTKASGLCRAESVGYKISCGDCEEQGRSVVMHGETAVTARKRVAQHVEDMRSKRSSNLREHNDEFHDGIEPNYKFEVVRMFPGDPLGRQLHEAMRIDSHVGTSLNDKGEWLPPAGVRIRVERR